MRITSTNGDSIFFCLWQMPKDGIGMSGPTQLLVLLTYLLTMVSIAITVLKPDPKITVDKTIRVLVCSFLQMMKYHIYFIQETRYLNRGFAEKLEE